MNTQKTTLGAEHCTYLGYNLNGEGIQPGQEKLKAVQKFPEPDSVKKIREFIGLANYFRFLQGQV